jgi:hypothetical protein
MLDDQSIGWSKASPAWSITVGRWRRLISSRIIRVRESPCAAACLR